ncbi:MAG: hypothetical protein ACLSVD_10065 [Eggerthellaceae bacterium]
MERARRERLRLSRGGHAGYENPEGVSADDLQALRDLLLAEDEARKIWK